MTHVYKLTGMTCGSCEAKVKSSLLMLPGVTEVEVSKENETATITMEKHIALSVFQNALDSKYTIAVAEHNETAEQAKSWLAIYKPVLLIFGYITGITLLSEGMQVEFSWMRWMNHFMAALQIATPCMILLPNNGAAGAIYMLLLNWLWVSPFSQATVPSLPIALPLW